MLQSKMLYYGLSCKNKLNSDFALSFQLKEKLYFDTKLIYYAKTSSGCLRSIASNSGIYSMNTFVLDIRSAFLSNDFTVKDVLALFIL